MNSAKLHEVTTKMMNFKFDQYEVESRADKVLEFGDDTKIAERVGKSSSIISQMFSPNEERESNYFKALKEICAELDIDQTRGKKLLRLFNEFAERHIDDMKPRCTQTETKKFNKELREYYDADMCNEPLEVQISELTDVESQARELRKAKEAELDIVRREYAKGNERYFTHR